MPPSWQMTLNHKQHRRRAVATTFISHQNYCLLARTLLGNGYF
jgi:hypothetical protein